jgi:hypothetical protein
MRAWELDGTLIWPLRVSSPQFNALTPRPAHQEPGVRAEEEAFAIGGAQAVQPPRRVLFADDPSVCEAPDCREEAIEPIGLPGPALAAGTARQGRPVVGARALG